MKSWVCDFWMERKKCLSSVDYRVVGLYFVELQESKLGICDAQTV